MSDYNMEAMNMDDFKEYKKDSKKPRESFDRKERDRKREHLVNAVILTNHMTMLTVGLTVGSII